MVFHAGLALKHEEIAANLGEVGLDPNGSSVVGGYEQAVWLLHPPNGVAAG
jgi:hypothetical protein